MEKNFKQFNDVSIGSVNGFVVIGLMLICLGFFVGLALMGGPLFFVAGLGVLALLVSSAGFYINGPNIVHVHSLFGKYSGTDFTAGFRWQNPFFSSQKLSLVIRNMETSTIKVNDANGNPIEVSAVFVWRISDAAAACFSVSSVSEFVKIQSETTLRETAMKFPYDTTDDTVTSLRGSSEEIMASLIENLKQRVAAAGVDIVDARFNKLSYAPEIASAMLQRQQAQAMIDARKLIVTGAVKMVEDALEQMDKMNKVEFTQEQKAQMVSNLLVVLTSDRAATPTMSL